MTVALFLIGGALYFAVNVMVYSHAERIISADRDYSHPKDPFGGRDLKISENREEDGHRFKRGYLEMAKFDDLEAGRRAWFSAYVRIEELLAPGETRPAEEMLPVFVKSRAILYAKDECERLITALARECAVNNADGRLKDGLVRIEGSMRFVQHDEFGEIDPTAEWVFANVSGKLAEAGAITSMARGAADRVALYRKAAQKCAEIKKRESNCAVTAIRIDTVKNHQGGYTLSASADYSFLTRRDG